MDVEHRIVHRLTQGLDRYTSLSASADGRRFVVTLARPKTTLWRLRLDDSPAAVTEPSPISLTTTTGFSPRLGPNYLVYTSATGASESIWKLAKGVPIELWRGNGAWIFGGPAISADGRFIAFSVRQSGGTVLYVMDQEAQTRELWRIPSTCKVIQHGRPTDSQLPRRRAIAVTRISFGCRSMVIPLPSSFVRIHLIQYGHPAAILSSSPDRTLAPAFQSTPPTLTDRSMLFRH